MKVDLERCFPVSAPPGDERFTATRSRTAAIVAPAWGGRDDRDALRHVVVECRAHELVDGRACAYCRHFLAAAPAPTGEQLVIRCLFFEDDPVESIMTRAEDLVTVDRDEPCAVAASRMLDHDVKQLLVTADDRVIGLVVAPSVALGEGAAGAAMSERFPVVARALPLGAVARALRAADLDVLGVVERDELVGLVTRGDLRRAGVPDL